MPYIRNELRQEYYKLIAPLAEKLSQLDENAIEGTMNYVVSTLIGKSMKPRDGWRYKNINRVLGVLEAVKLEFYRRVAEKYEDEKIATEGDIEVYK